MEQTPLSRKAAELNPYIIITKMGKRLARRFPNLVIISEARTADEEYDL